MNSQVSQNRRVKKLIINQLETEVVHVTCSYLITDIACVEFKRGADIVGQSCNQNQ